VKTLAVIPARYGSSRFPGKMLADLGGVPLVVRTARQAAKAKSFSEILVATDDVRIEEAVRAAGLPVVMTRADHPSGTDRIVEAVAGLDAECIVNVQGDEPFISPDTLDELVARMRAADAPEMGTACTPILQAGELHDPSVVKVVRDVNGCALYFSRSLIPHSRDEPPENLIGKGLYFRHLGLYAYRKSVLEKWSYLDPHPLENTEKLEQLRALANGCKIAVIETDQHAPGIDTPEDLNAAKQYLTLHPDRNA
jgi:3-deoxy-manno-octulosonate cytidylyltransferase (CMP-KDO synthetase)